MITLAVLNDIDTSSPEINAKIRLKLVIQALIGLSLPKFKST